jgi:predicted alpha/beta hydrolase family esterase
MDRLLDAYDSLMADVAADPDRPDLARRMSRLIGALRETRTVLAGHALGDAYAGEALDRDYRPTAAALRVAAVRPLFPGGPPPVPPGA